jgi:uncharacterized protein
LTRLTPIKHRRVARSKTGLGLFATETIKRGTLVAIYVGRKITNGAADKLYTKYIFELNGRYSIDGSSRRNIARYINHSCKPNSKVYIERGKILIRTIRRVQPGDEFTYHYGPDYFDAFIKPIGCKCESCIEERRKRRKRKAAGRRTGAKQRAGAWRKAA